MTTLMNGVQGIMPEIDNLQDAPPEVCAHWYQNFSEGKYIIIRNLEDIRQENPLQYANLKRQNIHFLVVVPICDNGRVIGFYGVDNPSDSSLDSASDLLQTVGYFILSCVRRRNVIQALREMSLQDRMHIWGTVMPWMNT